MKEILNTCIIDTIYGNRTINLIRENISESNDDLIIFSAYVKKDNSEVCGEILSSLKKKYKMKIGDKNNMITKIGDISIEFWKEKNKDSINNFLMARMIDYEENVDVLVEHDNNIRSIFGMLKLLEFNDISFRNISLSIIGGRKNIDYFENIKILLKYSIKYLKESRNTEYINFYIDGAEDEEENWNNAFEKTLGRTYYKQGSLVIIESLKTSLKDTIEMMFQSGKFKELEYVLNLIYRELEEVDSLSINNIAINSRKISEIIAKEIASRKQLNIHKIKYDLSAILNLLASKDIIAPWVIQYLHISRVFGNKSAHVETVIKYQPNRLYTDDFISILSTLYNILWFWYYNKEKI